MSLTTYEAFVISLGFFDVLYDGKLSVVYGVPWTGYTGVKCVAWHCCCCFFPFPLRVQGLHRGIQAYYWRLALRDGFTHQCINFPVRKFKL